MRLFALALALNVLAGLDPSSAEGLASDATTIILGSNGTITLKGNSFISEVILDYGANVEGFPTFEIISVSGDTSGLQITYSESLAVLLSSPTSDGPLGLAAAMDTYRINNYNITEPTNKTNRLIQGGFRYQKLALLTPGDMVLAKVGVKPSISTTPIASLPGSFQCSDDRINQIWNVGARTVQMNEIPARSIPDFWEVSSEGSLVHSLAPQSLSGVVASSLMDYEIEFDVKHIAGGFSFSALASTLNDGVYIWCNIANGSISANSGSSESADFLAFATLPANITVGNWYHVKAAISAELISIYLGSTKVLEFSQTYAFFGSSGLGAALGQSAMFRNFTLASPAVNFEYSAQLTDTSFLPDFLMGTNPLATAVDGSKRDRISYAGDLDVAVGSTMVSTVGVEYIMGTLELLGSSQMTPGFFSPTAKIQQEPYSKPLESNITGLIGYSFNMVTAVANFYQYTGNTSIAKEWAPKVVRMLDWADSQVLPGNGLFNISNPAFGGDWNYYDPSQSGVVTKFNMVYAYALQSSLTMLDDAGVNITTYRSRLDALRVAINTHLWNSELGAFYISEALTDSFGQDSNALAILAGVTNSDHTSSQVLSTLSELSTPSGPLAFSNGTVAAGFRKLISPYASAYHLRAAFAVGDATVANELLHSLWYPMADPAGTNYTGCFWETLDANGGPGLGAITSLCHAWASGPTGELSTYVLGATAVKPGFQEWQVSPMTLGLSWAAGTIPVSNGGIYVAWNATEGQITHLEIESPANTKGVVSLPVCGDGATWKLNGQAISTNNGTFTVNGGQNLVFSLS
ncbi:hypothetical protein AA0113_g10152 [Alternaria arborescens]|uniref:Alpha-L-rhamnosidase C-terminal domain-containing protein n=1 Tax=Alternaria arborescens TaxID=156630 RepID=A0A4Q4QWP6_9PLEO|nr:hypothetical protein AA0113_g10152 [Alternaria arborescens]